MGIRLLVSTADPAIIILIIDFLVKLIKDKRRDTRLRTTRSSILFLLFIGAYIAPPSVIIRTKICWAYTSLTASLLFLVCIYGVLIQGVKSELYLECLRPWDVVLACYVALMLPVELFYRGYYLKLYLWPSQFRCDSLTEETYEWYRDGIFGKAIYIIGNSYKTSDFTTHTSFRAHDKNRTTEGARVEFINSIRDTELMNGRVPVLREDLDHSGF